MTDAAAASRAAERLAAAVSDWYGSGARLVSLSGPEPHAWSYQFAVEAETAAGRVRLVVKIPRWEEAPSLEAALAAGPQESTRREYAALEAIAAAVVAGGDPGLVAVVPVAYLRDLNAVVTERLEAVPLRSRLGWWPGREGRRAELLRRAGRVLRRYHQGAAGAAAGRLDGIALAAEVEALGARPGCGGAPLGEALAALARQARELDGSPAALGDTHGDFNLANVLATDDGRVAVLDPNLVPGPLLEDAAQLLTCLRMRRARALTLGRIGRRGLARAEAAFLEGYGEVDAELLRCLRAVATARRGAAMAERLAAWPRPLRRAGQTVLRRYVTAELSALAG